uniref:Replication-associated protein n=1 Tax=Ciconia boyciana Circoviridae sp. TaxID=2814997 RepID=A0A8A4XAU3_9CIRC|nr:MAG: replication-associated protein [Ciconia boyciana Circoviridae sp.]
MAIKPDECRVKFTMPYTSSTGSPCSTCVKFACDMHPTKNPSPAKPSSGCSPSRKSTSPLTSLPTAAGLLDNSSSASQVPSTSTGKSWSPSPKRSLYEVLQNASGTSGLGPLSPPTQMTTSEKTTLPSLELDLSLALNPFSETPGSSGKRYGQPPFEEYIPLSRRMLELSIIGPSSRLLWIIQSLSRWKEFARCFGVILRPVNHIELGHSAQMILILRSHEPSSGAVTRMKKMLSSMNFAETSISRTSYGGLIGIRSAWRLNTVDASPTLNDCLLPPTKIRKIGIRPQMRPLSKPSGEDLGSQDSNVPPSGSLKQSQSPSDTSGCQCQRCNPDSILNDLGHIRSRLCFKFPQ